MKKIILVILMNTFFLCCSFGQEIEEILSFSYEIANNGAIWYKIYPIVKYEDGSIEEITDSICINDPNLSEMFPFSYSVANDWFVSQRCYITGDAIKCYVDSVLMYTPIKYFYDKNMPCKDDTIAVVDYSYFLFTLNEPKIFGRIHEREVLRFIWIQDTLSLIFRIEKRHSDALLHYKSAKWNNDNLVLVKDTSFSIDQQEYTQILTKLKRGNYWQIDNEFVITPRNILIESYIEDKYYFVNKNAKDLEYNDNKKLLNCFKMLKKRCN